MTPFETYFLQTTDYLDKLGLSYFLHGSTLLRIIRNKTVEPRIVVDKTDSTETLSADREINIACLAEDFTDLMYMKMRRDFPYFNPINNVFPNSFMWFAKEAPPIGGSHWQLRPGFSMLSRYWEGKSTRIYYMGDNHALVYPKEMFEKFETVEFLGREFRCPANPREYFSFYFGRDWETENQGWHWAQAKCYQTLENLGGGEIYG